MLLQESQMHTEASKDQQWWYIEGVFAQAEAKNKNGRIYREATLDREVARFDKEMIQTFQALGELNHPDHLHINPDRAAILITEMHKNGVDYVGKARVLNTPCGQIVQSLLEGGAVIGVSTRGSGEVRKNREGIMEVQDSFRLETVDAVCNPSAPKALMKAVYENEQRLDAILQDTMLYEEFVNYLKTKKRAKNTVNKANREAAMLESVKALMRHITKV